MPADEPRVGAVWELGPRSAFPGLLVAIAARDEAGMYEVLLLVEHAPDEVFHDVALDDDTVRWLGDPPAERPRTLVTAATAPVLREDLGRKVGTLPRALRDTVVGAAYQPPGRLRPETAPPGITEPSPAYTADMRTLMTLHLAHEDAVAHAPTVAERRGFALGANRLRAAFAGTHGDGDVERRFVDEDRESLARVTGTPGGTRIRLEVDFGELDLGPGPVLVALVDADEQVIASHVFDRADVDAAIELEALVDAATSDDVAVVFGLPRVS